MFTTTDLLASVKNKALVPNSQNTFEDEDLLAIADEEVQTGIVPMILEARQEYFVAHKEYQITANQEGYNIPPRAIGGKLMDVTLFDSVTLSETRRDNERSLPMIQADMAPYRNTTWYSYEFQSFFLRGNKVLLTPVPSSTIGVLRLYYYQRPNKLVSTAQAARIDSIDTVNNQIVVANLPTTFQIGTKCDFVKAISGFENLAIDQTITNISGLTITFSSLPSELETGDYLCIAGETPVVQLPAEFHAILAQRVAVKVLEALGDSNGSQLARTKLLEMETNARVLIQPRVEGEFIKITNPFSTLNSPGRITRWRGY